MLLQYLAWSGQTTNNSFFTETGPGSAFNLYTNHIGVMANRTVSVPHHPFVFEDEQMALTKVQRSPWSCCCMCDAANILQDRGGCTEYSNCGHA